MTDHDFYHLQNEWSSIYLRDVSKSDIDRVMWVNEITGKKCVRLLELGAGGGQFAVAASQLNHKVTAVELEPDFVEHMLNISRLKNSDNLTIVNADFYLVKFDHTFDIICYWDGFGIGCDLDQKNLLRNISSWLAPGGSVLLEIYTPWFWASEAAGVSFQMGSVSREYGFDAESCSLIDTWWKTDNPAIKKSQRLRCYSPADLNLLLEDTGLQMIENFPGGRVEYSSGTYTPKVPLNQAMSYITRLTHSESKFTDTG